jgi:hypothetical protein
VEMVEVGLLVPPTVTGRARAVERPAPAHDTVSASSKATARWMPRRASLMKL